MIYILGIFIYSLYYVSYFLDSKPLIELVEDK